MNNYPPGVSGNEYEIAGPDYEQELDELCCKPYVGDARRCDGSMFELGYRGNRWKVCGECGYRVDLESIEYGRYDADPGV